MNDRVQILFETNAKEEALSIAELNKQMKLLVSSSQSGSPKSGKQSREAITRSFVARNREDLSRQSDINAINTATGRGLTARLDTATAVSAKLLKGTKGAGLLIAELEEGVGYAIDEKLRPLKQAAAMLRKKAKTTKNPEKAMEYENYAKEIETYVGQYEKLQVGQKAAKRAFREGAPLHVLEKAQTAFQKIGIEIGSIGDLSKFENRISAISPAIAGDVKALRKSFSKLSTEDYTKLLGEIAMRGVAVVTQQKAAFDKQIKDEVNSRAGKGGGYASVFEKRFGSVKDMLASGKTFDMSSLEDQAAFGVFKDNLRGGLGGYIKSQLDPKSFTGLTQLQTAKATGDTDTISEALKKAEKQVNTRLSRMREQLDKLADIAKATGDQDMLNIVNGFRRQIRAQGETLAANLTSGAAKVQQSLDKSLQKTMDDMTNRFRVARRTKTMTSKEGIGKLTDTTDELIFQGISDFTAMFKKKSFQSLGGKTMEEAGLKRNQQNILNTQVLGKTGFFSAKTQEERMSALDDAFQHIKPALMGVGLKGKELADAEQDLQRMLVRMTSIYGELANNTQGLNAKISEEVRTRAVKLVKQGKTDEALALVRDASQYVAADVNAGRPSKTGGGKTGQAATDVSVLNERARADMQTNDEYIQGLIADRTNNPKNTFMGKLRTASAFAGSLLNVYGLVASAVGTVVMGISNLIQKANELDKVTSTVNALGGSFSNFSNAMKVATQQQAMYGGTLTETMQGLTSLMPLTKRYGADLGQLDNVARRLAVIDPLQGFQGASIALKEFFSGDITSLSRRFEIDRKSLNAIKEAGSQVEQLQALDKALNDMGISNDVLAAKTQTASINFDRAGAAWENFTTLLGKKAQSVFSGAAASFADGFKLSGQELASIEEREQYVIDLQKQLARTAAKFKDLGSASVDATDTIGNALAGSIAFVNDINKGAESVENLITEWNGLIEKINEVRQQNNEPLLTLFSKEDKDTILQLIDISNKTNIPIVDLLKNRDLLGNQMDTEAATSQARTNQNPWDFITSFFGGGSQEYLRSAMAGRMQALPREYLLPNVLKQKGNYLPFQENPEKANLPQIATDMTFGTFQSNIEKAGIPLTEALKVATDKVNLLPDQTREESIKNLKEATGIDFGKKAKELYDQLSNASLTQEQSTAIVMQIIELDNQLISAKEKILRQEEQTITNTAKTLRGEGATLNDSLIKKLDDFNTKRAAQMQSQAARAYGEAGGGAINDPNNAKQQQIIKFSQEELGMNREQLYYLNEIEKKQSMLTLEAGKSVSAYTALTNLTSGLGITLQEAVSSAIEFNKQIQGIASGTVFGQLSLQDRLNVNSSYFQNVGGIGGPQNSGDITSGLNQGLGLLQEQANASLGYSKQVRDINEKYEKEKTKITEDGEKDRTKIMEDWAESVKKLIKESEYTKRAATADFYEFLYQNDNLTKEQRDTASAQREGFFAEASSVRTEDPEKAANILSAGEQLVRNRVTYEESVAKFQKDNLDIDEQIGELQRDLGKAKDTDARKDIQRKIDKLKAQKDINNNEILQAQQVYELRKKADEQLLADARAGINSEKEARDRAIQETYDKEKENQRLLTLQKNTDLDDLKTKQDSNAAAQIMNLQDYQKLQQIGYIQEEAARMAAAGRSQKDIKDYLDTNLNNIKQYYLDRGTPAGKLIVDAINAAEKLPGSVYNGVNRTLAEGLGNGGTAAGSIQGGLPPEVSNAIGNFVSYTYPDTTPGVGPNGPIPLYKDVPTALSVNASATNNNTIANKNNTDSNNKLRVSVNTLSDNFIKYTLGRP